jgi:hypothetical protein
VTKRLVVSVICSGLTLAPACAQFGFGITVFDPTSWGELVQQLTQLQQQYDQLVKTYNVVTNQYNQMVINAKMISSKNRWKALLTPWKFPAATNTYGTTAGWISALNTGYGSLNGYQRAVTPINTYASVWGTIDSSQQDQIGRNYATVELSDGVTVNALDQLGNVRGNTASVSGAIDNLEFDSLSDDDALNTEVGVLNKINAANIIAARNGQDTNKLLASLVDHQMVEAKSRRDAEAQSINNDIALRQIAPGIDDRHLSGATDVLTSYRLP